MGLFTTKRSEFEYQQPKGMPNIPSVAKPVAGNRPISRNEIPISRELMTKHEESRRRYPRIPLSKGEYVIMEVRRHPIGLISIWVSMTILIFAALAVIPIYAMNVGSLASVLAVSAERMPDAAAIMMLMLALALVFLLGGLIAVYVYNSNLFYLTNESIIQYIQNSIFSTKQQQINLVNVDDVSHRQQGILQQVLNYGTVRVSTEGDERNPYVFYFVASPQIVTRAINEAMEEATGFAVRYRQHKQNIDTADPTLPPPEQF